MAKKRNVSCEDVLRGVLANSVRTQDKKWTKNEIGRIFSGDPSKQTAEQRHLMIASAIFVQSNITPETYQILYDIAKNDELVRLLPVDLLINHPGDFDDGEDSDDGEDDFGFGGRPDALRQYRKGGSCVTGFPMPNADKKTLLLKIQLRGVTKPPLWREVRVPANFDFEQLHHIIQILFGWTDSHLWQFEPKPYGHDFIIGPAMLDDGIGEAPSDIAAETPVTKVLKQVGDKIAYLYDFGDDWIHDITVKEVIDEASEHAVCTKWKGDNPMEDIGGLWGLDEMRHMADPKIKHTKKEIKEFLDNSWYESMEDFMEAMEELKFDEPYVNDELKSI